MERRVISLIDMDCFYVQVERHKNPNLIDKPVILCQHGSANTMALSISYEARKFGIKRSTPVKEAKLMCPELEVVYVPPMQNLDKGDLTCYKEASDSIFDVMLEFCGSNVIVEKASVDEAYMDLTKEIDNVIKDEKFKKLLERPEDLIPEVFTSTYAFHSDTNEDFETSKQFECLKQYLNQCLTNQNDMALLAGAFFMERLRKEICEKTGYECSAGIASNKMLAKLIASRHKPKSQTVLPHMSSIAFLDKAELQSVRWFGGKFGKEIVDKLQIKTVGEIHKIPINFLKNAFPSDYTRILNLANGICNEPVVQRIMPKSLSVAKILYNVDKEKILHWANGLASELIRRLEQDQNKFSRTANSIEISVTFTNKTRVQKTFNISFYKLEPIYNNIRKFFVNHYGTDDESKWTPGASYMSLHAKKFGALNTNIQTISDFLEPENNVATSDEISVIFETVKKRKKPTLKKKTPKTKMSVVDNKQSKLNFNKVSDLKKPLLSDTLIELSSDSEEERPTSTKSFRHEETKDLLID